MTKAEELLADIDYAILCAQGDRANSAIEWLSAMKRKYANLAAQADAQGGEIQDTYLVGGPPDLKAMSGSIDDRVIQLHFRRRATDADLKWLLEAINSKLLADASPTSSDAQGGEVVAWRYQRESWEGIWRYSSSPITDQDFETPGDWIVEPLCVAPPLSIEPQRAGAPDTRPESPADRKSDNG